MIALLTYAFIDTFNQVPSHTFSHQWESCFIFTTLETSVAFTIWGNVEISTLRNKAHETIYSKSVMVPVMKSFARGLFFHWTNFN